MTLHGPSLATGGRQVVPMENPGGRERVEAGEVCLRKNGRDVDINRNWGVHWGHKEADYDPKEEYPGTAPFRWQTHTTWRPGRQHPPNPSPHWFVRTC